MSLGRVVKCVNCKQKAQLQALPPPLSGCTCSECGWISTPTGGTLTSGSGQPYLLQGDAQLLSPDDSKQRLRMWSRPAPELKLFGAAFWQRDAHDPLLRSMSTGIDLSSVRAHRSQAAVLQRDESERLLQAFRAKGITVSEAAVRRGLVAPADRAGDELTLPDRNRTQRSLQPSQSVPELPRVSGGATLLARTHLAVDPELLSGVYPTTHRAGPSRGAAATLLASHWPKEAVAGGMGSSRPGTLSLEEPSAARVGDVAGASVAAQRGEVEGAPASSGAALRAQPAGSMGRSRRGERKSTPPVAAELRVNRLAATPQERPVAASEERLQRRAPYGEDCDEAGQGIRGLPTRYLRPPPVLAPEL